MKHWIAAFRLRTLPLAFSSIIMGSFLAAYYGLHRPEVTTLCILTTLFLQILSNLANDYGDFSHGADNDERIGPARAMQSGVITAPQMKRAIILFGVLALVSGVALIFVSLGLEHLPIAVGFLALGLGAIWAAYNYTAGSNPYGYRAMGDLFVFLFFGIVAVGGTFYLHTGIWDWVLLLPASASGLMAVSVLNVNNMRDLEPDRNAGKVTLPVLIGPRKARHYQMLLIDGIILLPVLFVYLKEETFQWQNYAFVVMFIPYFLMGLAIFKKPADEIDPFLKRMALMATFTTLLFGWSILY